LKFQNDALILYFKSQINVFKIPKLKNDLESFIRLQLQKEITLRNALIGMVLGLMSEEELAFYLLHKNELSRRIVSMLIQRLSTGVML
jgi:5,10-methylenetetrahydrofolate reductase